VRAAIQASPEPAPGLAERFALTKQTVFKRGKRACPSRIHITRMDNGKDVTDRLFSLRKRQATGAHEVDQLGADLGIEHRLTPPQSPQANDMVKRFNGRVEAVRQSHYGRSGEDPDATLHRFVRLYTQHSCTQPWAASGSCRR